MDGTVTVKGQTTIPKRFREGLGVSQGGKIRIFQHSDGSIHILPVIPASALRDLVASSKNKKTVTIEQMDEGIAEAVTARDRRSKR